MTPPQRFQSTVLRQTEISPGAFELVLDRAGLTFRAGHEIYIHGKAPGEDRQYSILSGTEEHELRILYRLIPEGVLTPQLAALRPGDPIAFTGPTGQFLLRDPARPVVCIATGTGIAPFVSFALSHPDLNLTVYHGVRDAADLFYREVFQPEHFVPCISGGTAPAGCLRGRVTEALGDVPTAWHTDTQVYLCGANAMILETRRLLLAQGLDDRNIFSEAYYFA